MTNMKLLLTAGVDERVDVTTSLFKTKNNIFFLFTKKSQLFEFFGTT